MPILTKTIYGDGKVYFGDSAINYASIGVAEVYFQGYSINQGAIEGADFVRFTDDSQNFNSVECDIIQIIQRAVNRGQMEAFTRALFNDYAENSSMGSIVSPYVVIDGDVILDGTTTAAVVTISGNAEIQGEIYASVSVEFLDYASSTATAIISGNVSFKANSLNNGGAIIGNVSLFDNASNTGSVSGDVELYDNASNTGSVSGDVELYDNASNTGSVSGDVITYSSITLNSTNYLYAGTLSSGITIILDPNKTLVANISGTDTINGTNSNWSTNGSGVLTYSAVGSGGVGINHPYVHTIGLNSYYSDSPTLVNGIILYASQNTNDTPPNNTFFNMTSRYVTIDGILYIESTYAFGSNYINASDIGSATAMYDGNGNAVSSSTGVESVSGDYYLYSVSNGTFTGIQVYAFGSNYINASDIGSATAMYDSDGITVSSATGVESVSGDYYLYSVSSGIFTGTQVYAFGNNYINASTINTATAMYDSDGITVSSSTGVESVSGDYYLYSVGSGAITTTQVYAFGSNYINASTINTATAMYDGNGITVSSSTGIESVSGDYYLYSVSSGVITTIQVYAFGNNYINASTINTATAMYDSDGITVSSATGVASAGNDYYLYSVSSGVITTTQVYAFGNNYINASDIGSATYMYDGNGITVSSSTGVAPLGNDYCRYSVSSGTIATIIVYAFGSNYINASTIANATYMYDGNGITVSSATGVAPLGNDYYQYSVSSGTITTTQVYAVTSEDGETYLTNSIDIPTKIYSVDGLIPASLQKIINYNGTLKYTTTDGLGSNFSSINVHKGTASYMANSNSYGPFTVYIESDDYSSSGNMYLASGNKVGSETGAYGDASGVFNYENTTTYKLFSITSYILTFVSEVYLLPNQSLASSYYFSSDNASSSDYVYDLYGSAIYNAFTDIIVVGGSDLKRIYASNGTVNDSVVVYANGLNTYTTYYTTSVNVSTGDYAYNADGSIAGGLSLDYIAGTTLTTDSNGQIAIY